MKQEVMITVVVWEEEVGEHKHQRPICRTVLVKHAEPAAKIEKRQRRGCREICNMTLDRGGGVAAIREEGAVGGCFGLAQSCFVPPLLLCTCVYTDMAAAAQDLQYLS